MAAYEGPVDGVIACNDAGYWWPHELDVFCSLHPEKMMQWLLRRHENGYPAPKMLASYQKHAKGPKLDLVTGYLLPGQHESGSSGLFMAKIALVDLGFDRAVLCGVPLTRTPHIKNSLSGAGPWHRDDHYRKKWQPVREDYLARIASMSGWTNEFLGGPEKWH